MRERGQALPAVFLALMVLVAAWVGLGVVRAAGDARYRSGLEYRAFRSAFEDVFRPGDPPLIVARSVEVPLADGTVATIDTLAVVADSVALPGFQQGGFLRDNVEAFNRVQWLRAEFGLTDSTLFRRPAGHGRSVYRVEEGVYRVGGNRRDDRSRVVPSPAVWNLAIPSPFQEAWFGRVLARSSSLVPGLLGPGQAIPLDRSTRREVVVQGRRRPCDFEADAGDVRVYCLSQERLPQVSFTGIADPAADRSMAVSGWDHLWLQGRRLPPNDSSEIRRRESVMVIPPLPPVLFSDYWEGQMSSIQWINGRARRRGEGSPPLDLLGDLGRARPNSGAGDVRLSVDSEASLALTRSLNAFLGGSQVPPVDFAVAMVAMIPSGEILAIGETGARLGGRSNFLRRVAPGSTVKPLLAAAVLSEEPGLDSLRVRARSGPVRSVQGLPVLPAVEAFRTQLYCEYPSDGWVDLQYFIRCSSNEYAAALVMAGFGRNALQGRGVPRDRLLTSPLARGINTLYGLATDPQIADDVPFVPGFWSGVTFESGEGVVPPADVMPARSRPALLATHRSEGTDIAYLYRYAYGAWENRWTVPDLVQGFARIATDQALTLTMAADPAPSADALGLAGQAWYPTLLQALRRVGEDGTAPGLNEAWTVPPQAVRSEGSRPRTTYAKTGTLNEPNDRLFVKALLFATGEPDSGQRALACGFAGAVYFKFRTGPPGGGSLPSYQVDFARTGLAPLLRELLERHAPCG